jgi:4-alpha-glucanotransferase
MDFVEHIKKAAGDCMLIAEDLGNMTEEVRQLVEDSGIPGMRVLQFGFLDSSSSPHLPHNFINNCVAYTGTHDNNTLLGYIWELDDSTRRKVLDYCGFAGENWDSCYNEILRTMFASHAGLLILPVQDLLLYGSDTRLNTPGKADGNWRYRVTKEQLDMIDWSSLARLNKMYSR